MATTSIWSVKGWLGKVVIYVENPEKTMNPKVVQQPEIAEEESQGLSDVIAYAVNEEKTRRNEKGEIAEESETVMEQYVSGVNCTPTTARTEMMAVKKRYGKDEGIMAFHGYQSFAPGECTPAMAHEIGVKLAEELWGNRFQVLVATHLDKAHHLHNHFVVNSVSFTDGLRYHRTNQDYRDMRRVSDRLCREYKLSVIENPKPGKTQHYGEWRAHQEGRPTYRGIVQADVDEAIRKARTERQFFHYLKEKGYTIKIGKDITVRPEGKDRGLKLARNFGEEYTLESIRRRILIQNREICKSDVSPKKEPVSLFRLHGTFNQRRKIGGLRGLYLHYCYLLGILPKSRPQTSTRQMHFLLREDLRKLNQITKETRLLCRYHIDTAEQLFSWKETCENRLEQLERKRKSLRYRVRSVNEEETRMEMKAEITGLTEQMGKLREEVKLCDGIAARSGLIKEKIKIVRQENRDRKTNY
ncbi:relaxase/mobilization nuclease domain-containing protein [Extibacter muris]|uniref:Relaxase/mobilization nuclease n=1 Tax=Extibacter muris TaxID=1796622 RepID=A0A4R4F8M4_9FIRM|nr:relaxase/mobilization nuclease domain-containing protein [Extibacter muris]MCU0081380.1 relaxase/mobilization nuclease domain-containing protein [Extibacter muris]TDA20112.1 relaxase/mobilization nuclease [Extibacter muris]